MEVRISLTLPRDVASVPLVRHLCRHSLEELKIVPSVVADIELAVAEACTNVLRHAGSAGVEYEVRVRVDSSECEITVKDTGGFDLNALPAEGPSLTSEGGRGVFLMRALVDTLDFASEPSSGTTVHLRKAVELMPEPARGQSGAVGAPILD